MGKIDLDRFISKLLSMHPNPLNGKITTNDIESALLDQGLLYDGTNVVDKVIEIPPLFHVGDWVVHKYTKRVSHICSVSGELYVCDYGASCFSREHENDYKTWELTDARNGDVLTLDTPTSKITFISHGNDSYCGNPCEAHAGIGWHGNKVHVFLSEPCGLAYKDRIHPADANERQTFISELKKWGYWWDHDMKEIMYEKPSLTPFEEHLKNIIERCCGTKCVITADKDVKEYAKELLELVDK